MPTAKEQLPAREVCERGSCRWEHQPFTSELLLSQYDLIRFWSLVRKISICPPKRALKRNKRSVRAS